MLRLVSPRHLWSSGHKVARHPPSSLNCRVEAWTTTTRYCTERGRRHGCDKLWGDAVERSVTGGEIRRIQARNQSIEL